MTLKRFFRAFRSFNRIPEIWRCCLSSSDPLTIIFGFLQISQPRYPYIFKYKNYVIELKSWDDLATVWVVFWGKEYRFLNEDKRIIDVGANIGVFTLLACELCPIADIISVEPYPDNFSRLRELVEKHGLDDRVKLESSAIAGAAGKLFMDASEEVGSSSRRVISAEFSQKPTVSVSAMSLNDLLEKYDWDEVDFLKMDIEGAEYEFFKTTPVNVLRRCKRIAFEYHESGDQKSIFEKLEHAGFEVSYFPKKGKAGVVEYKRVILNDC